MSRTLGITIVCVTVSSSLAFADEPKSAPADHWPRTELVPDPRWQPAPGQHVSVPADATPAARTLSAWESYEASRKAHDVVGIDRGYGDGSLTRLAKGQKVLVLHDHAPARTTSRSSSSAEFASSLVNARPVSLDEFPVEVRVMDGPHADRLAFVSRRDIAKLVERRVVPPLNPGDRATVAKPESVIARDHNDLYSYKFAQIDNDKATIVGLLRSGMIARLNAGARVVILRADGEFARVRVHSGSRLVGNVGYVPAGDLIPPEPSTPAGTRTPAR